MAHDQTNCFAALGLGNILAYFNKTEDAQEIFKIISLSNPNIFQPLMNQAHLAIGEKKFELSINLYKTILEKFLPNHLRTEMYLAKAFFVKGDYEASKSIILNLLARFPQHIPLKFNLALCLFQQAEKIFNQDVRRVYQTN